MNEMVHRKSLREIRRQETRHLVLMAARRVLARAGFAGASIEAIAREAGIASGTVYLHFDNRAHLFGELFELASGWETRAMAQASREGDAATRLKLAIRTFLNRAINGRRLAWAMIAEPVDPVVEAARLVSRREFSQVLTGIIEDGVAEGSMRCADPKLAGRFLIGAITECLVNPLSPDADDAALETDRETLTGAIENLCLAAAGVMPQAA